MGDKLEPSVGSKGLCDSREIHCTCCEEPADVKSEPNITNENLVDIKQEPDSDDENQSYADGNPDNCWEPSVSFKQEPDSSDEKPDDIKVEVDNDEDQNLHNSVIFTKRHQVDSEEIIPAEPFSSNSSRNSKLSKVSDFVTTKRIGKRKQTSLSLDFKIQLLKEVDKKNCSKSAICRKYNIPNSTLSTIIRNREDLEKAMKAAVFRPDRKRMRSSNNDLLDKALLSWFKQARALEIPITGPMLLEKAEEMVKEINSEVKVNHSWIDRFKTRNGISFRPICGELTSAPKLRKLLEEFQMKNIFSACETGLFYHCLPHETLTLKGETCSGGELSVNRLTVLFCANMDGSEKLPLFVIGKYPRTQAFKNVTSLPTEYRSNAKAWMTPQIFEDWVFYLDKKFSSEKRKIAIIVGNCAAHPNVENLQSISLVFLSPKTERLIHPCHQGIIKNFKQKYRKLTIKRFLVHIEQEKSSNFNLDILQALRLMRSAWNQVTQEDIFKCFKYVGWKKTEQQLQDLEIKLAENCQPDEEMVDLFERLNNIIPVEGTPEAYVAIDDDLYYSTKMAESDIASLTSDQEEDSEEIVEEDGDFGLLELPPTLTEARQALSVFFTFAQTQHLQSCHYDALDKLQDLLDEATLSSLKQT